MVVLKVPRCVFRLAYVENSEGKPLHSASMGVEYFLSLILSYLGETGPLSQGVQAGENALRIHQMTGVEVRKKRPRGFK